MFAVIRTGGKQYRVAENEVISVERLAGEVGDIVELSDVLMVGGPAGAAIGTPMVAGASVTAEIVGQLRARKVLAFKKRRRQNSKRIRGHRQMLTSIRIAEILTDGARPKKTAAKKAPAAQPETPAEAPSAEKPAKAARSARPAPDKAEGKAETAAKAKTTKADKPAAKKTAAKKPAKDGE
ncbi:MAG: hypothetical protein BroJett030_03820 [Alphaproteobacteria bacterium]|nr:MAG: hypothetical protein BroJett030_03820 [Alphaproteobacteria bacterium]